MEFRLDRPGMFGPQRLESLEVFLGTLRSTDDIHETPALQTPRM
jgi:hypothetical protein